MLQVGIFVAVTGVVLAVLRALTGSPGTDARLRRRLADEFGTDARAALSPLYKNLDTLGDSDVEDAPDGARPGFIVRPTGWQARSDEFLSQAGVSLTARQVFTITGGVAAIGGAVGLVSGGALLGATAAAVAAVVPFAVLNLKRKVRRDTYDKQLAGTFELMARVLRSGQSVPEAFRAAVDTFGDPLADEFGRCLHQIEHGLRPEAAYRELSDRADILELRLFVVAMTIQRQSGGNLSEVLDRLASVIRTRLRLHQKIRALTAEGRLQSLTLTVLPVITFAAMYFLNRPYAELLLVQWRLLVIAVGCVTVGTLWIRNIMNFEG